MAEEQQHYVSNKDETARLFDKDWMEFFSRVNWKTPLFLYIPVIAYFLYASFSSGIKIAIILGLFLGGILAWSLIEYVIHRFIFHFHPKSNIGKRIMYLSHGIHHAYPNDTKRLVMVPTFSIPLAFVFYFSSLPLFGAINVQPFFAGLVAGYLVYDTTHYAIHHFNMKSKFWANLKVHHMKHHYQDPEKGYGVSSKFWDKVFGSDYKTE